MSSNCSVDACEHPKYAKDMCSRHYQQIRKHGRVSSMEKAVCLVEGCTTTVHAKGRCKPHWSKHRKETRSDICSVVDCNDVVQSLGLCSKHYGRKYHYGDVTQTAQDKPKRNHGVSRDESCSVEGCSNSLYYIKTRLCKKHKARLERVGSVELPPKQSSLLCVVEGCSRNRASKGLCSTHRNHMKKYGEIRVVAGFNVCSVTGCTEKYLKNGFCQKHWRQVKNVPGWTSDTTEWVGIISGDPCAYFWRCGSTADTLEHIIPVFSGGDNAWDNLAFLCRSCNSSKGTFGMLQFMLGSVNECA